MKTLKNINGWVLSKTDEEYNFTTPDGFIEKYSLNNDIDTIYRKFEEAINRGWIWVNYDYYTVSIDMDDIKCVKCKSSIKSNLFDNNTLPTGRYSTKESAIAAISLVLPKAKEKLRLCAEALNKLQVELDFECGDSYEGDTHGLYNEHSYISFRLDDFNFSFINQ